MNPPLFGNCAICMQIRFLNEIFFLDIHVTQFVLNLNFDDAVRLTGTKLGCGEGGCGACTVMISRYDRTASTIRHFAANACLTPVCAVHGFAVTTVEGIGGTPKGGDPAGRQRRLHAVQERLAKAHGSQCGFCTPGFVMSMYTLLRNTAVPTMSQVEEGFQGLLNQFLTKFIPPPDGF